MKRLTGFICLMTSATLSMSPEIVKCDLNVDNVLQQLSINGQDVTRQVVGDLTSKNILKTIEFQAPNQTRVTFGLKCSDTTDFSGVTRSALVVKCRSSKSVSGWNFDTSLNCSPTSCWTAIPSRQQNSSEFPNNIFSLVRRGDEIPVVLSQAENFNKFGLPGDSLWANVSTKFVAFKYIVNSIEEPANPPPPPIGAVVGVGVVGAILATVVFGYRRYKSREREPISSMWNPRDEDRFRSAYLKNRDFESLVRAFPNKSEESIAHRFKMYNESGLAAVAFCKIDA